MVWYVHSCMTLGPTLPSHTTRIYLHDQDTDQESKTRSKLPSFSRTFKAYLAISIDFPQCYNHTFRLSSPKLPILISQEVHGPPAKFENQLYIFQPKLSVFQ